MGGRFGFAQAKASRPDPIDYVARLDSTAEAKAPPFHGYAAQTDAEHLTHTKKAGWRACFFRTSEGNRTPI